MRAFTGPLLPPMLFSLVSSVFSRDMSLAPRGEFHHDRNRHPVIFQPHSVFLLFPSALSFGVFSLLALSLRPLHNTASSCLHIAWSKATNWSFPACSLRAFLSHHSHPAFTDASSAFSPGTIKNMQHAEEIKWHIEKRYCQQQVAMCCSGSLCRPKILISERRCLGRRVPGERIILVLQLSQW